MTGGPAAKSWPLATASAPAMTTRAAAAANASMTLHRRMRAADLERASNAASSSRNAASLARSSLSMASA